MGIAQCKCCGSSSGTTVDLESSENLLQRSFGLMQIEKVDRSPIAAPGSDCPTETPSSSERLESLPGSERSLSSRQAHISAVGVNEEPISVPVKLPPQTMENLHRKSELQRERGPRCPNDALMQALKGKATNWATLRRICTRICEPDYAVHEYLADLGSMPELRLYLLDSGSGLDLGYSDEYQRTIGTFLAIYWLMRVHIDGKSGFTYGVDANWVPVTPTASHRRTVNRFAKQRLTFYSNNRWDYFEKLFIDAGLKTIVDGKEVVNERRLLTLLVLTAIHDIMKMEFLQPRVTEGSYLEYQAGDVIHDHDHALSYVLEHYPSVLPSFDGLDGEEQRLLCFTQCRLCFNHGWFVQAEAPPGAVFTKFRQAVLNEPTCTRSDAIAFYFVHWFTDLAGAEPTPLRGCEKFAVKFPLRVLNSFIRSTEFIQHIGTSNETEVMERYLKVCWEEQSPSLGVLPVGHSSIALMRLACMAQHNAQSLVTTFREELGEEDRQFLSIEMARTACADQTYSAKILPADGPHENKGPALLIYYGPAFLQNLGTDKPLDRLRILVEVYRRARLLWPEDVAKAGATATVMINLIKGSSIEAMLNTFRDGMNLAMVKLNESEAVLEGCTRERLQEHCAAGLSFQVLDWLPMTSCLQRARSEVDPPTSARG